ncbi:hypothetical protein V1517DRAFT_376980 [Lipomyces orientalis]|uniref:Uncharacterized protein n=1 Tax=Lipomyces orientalis TaxID=1233043 RepID=A0ACC3TCH2_9ASCO
MASPNLGANQVQIKVTVAGLNPHDRKSRDAGLFISQSLPAVLANDVVGKVNGLQKYALAAVGSMAKVPVQLWMTRRNITNQHHCAPWSRCLSVQLAKLAGIGRIIVVGGNKSELKGFGATHVIDRHAGYDVVLGRVREMDGQILALNALSSRKRGTLARLLPLGPVDESKVLELAGPFWERVPEYLEAGKLKSLSYVVKQGLEAGYVNEVLDAYRDGNSVFKTHIHL